MRYKFFIYLFFCTLLCCVFSCQSNQDVTANTVDLSDVPDQEGWNSTLVSTSKGMISSKINYVHMKKYSKKRLVKFVEGVEFELFNEDGEYASIVRADEAVLNENQNHVDLIGDVLVKSKDGLTLSSESLNWDRNIKRITTEKFVTIVTAENDTLYGQGFESEESLQNWTIKEPSGVTQKKLLLDIKDEGKTDQ